MSDNVDHALSAYDMRDLRGRGWQDHGPVLEYLDPGSLDDLYWRPGEIIVWIVTRNEQAMRGFNGLAAKMMSLHQTSSREIYEKSIHGCELLQDAAGHHRECPRLRFEEICDCDDLGRRRYCHCQPAETSWIGSCDCVSNALKALFRAVEDGLPIRGRREGTDEFNLLVPSALAKLSIFYSEHGLQLLPTFPEVQVAKAEVLRRWPADGSDRATRNSPASIADGHPEHGRRPMFEEALTIFCERLRQGKTKPKRLDEMEIIEVRMAKRMDRDSITKAVRDFYALVEWNSQRPINGDAVIIQVDRHVQERQLKRINATQSAKKRTG